jgi:hypothetical protein
VTVLGLSLIAWTFFAAALLFLALVAAGYLLQLVRDAKRLARDVSHASDRLRAAGDDVRVELERASEHTEYIRDLRAAGKDRRPRP